MKKKILSLIILAYAHASLIKTETTTVAELRERAKQYRQHEQFEKAIACYEAIVKQNTSSITDWFAIGCNAISIGNFDYAIEAFDTVLFYAPHAVAAWYNKGFTYKQMGELEKAITLLEQLVRQHPEHDAAHMCLAYSYMMHGDMLSGYTFHTRHLHQAHKYAPEFRSLLENMQLYGKTILLVPEGGLGDTLQFIRYAERIKQLGAHIIATVQKPLIPLLTNSPFIDEIIPPNKPLPTHDAKITLMSLPAACYDTLETIPCTIPYIFPDKKLAKQWKEKLSYDNNFKIGICWQASIANDESRLPVARRGCPLTELAQLFTIPGTSWYSLQQHDGLEELTTIDITKLHLFDNSFDATHGAFMDTAAVMESLDLIITIDSAIAHLTGALGKPVWLLLPLVTDWRWIAHKTTSPWYPTMRIFKQTEPFEWNSVITKVAKALEKTVNK